MLLKKIKFKNVISNSFENEISFLKKVTSGDEDRFFDSSIRKKKRSKNSQEGILKTLAITGKNSSYKSSTLNSINILIDFVTKFKRNVENFDVANINFDKAMEWFEDEYGILPSESELNFSQIIRKYHAKIRKNKNIKKIVDRYVEDFYRKNSFDKNEPLIFEIVFIEPKTFEEVEFKCKISMEKNIVRYLFVKNKEKIDLYNDLIEINFTHNIASAEHYLLNGRRYFYNPQKNIFLTTAMEYLFTITFKNNEEKFIEFLSILDSTIIGINSRSKKIKTKKRFNIINIIRTYDGIKENIPLNNLSSGTKIFICYLYFILKTDFIIIDEIEQSLHLKLVEILLDVAKNNNKQILFTTHNPLIVKKFIKNYELYIYEKDSKNRLKITKGTSLYSGKDDFINKYLNDLISGISDYDADFIRMELYE